MPYPVVTCLLVIASIVAQRSVLAGALIAAAALLVEIVLPLLDAGR